MFGNPLFQEYDYRSYVIHFVPSLKVLDRKGKICRAMELNSYVEELPNSCKNDFRCNKCINFCDILYHLEILKTERDKSFKKYEPHRDMVKETISFGRCVEGPPQRVYYPPSTALTIGNTVAGEYNNTFHIDYEKSLFSLQNQ